VRKLPRMPDTTPLPDDIDALKAMLAEARALLAERDLVIEQLKAQIDKLRRMQFGRKRAGNGCHVSR
jgi:transposase